MNIKIKLTPDQVFALEKLCNIMQDWTPTQAIQKAQKSIMLDVADKIHNQYRKISKTADLFNTSKKIVITFKYHELQSLILFTSVRLKSMIIQNKAQNDLLMFRNEYENLVI